MSSAGNRRAGFFTVIGIVSLVLSISGCTGNAPTAESPAEAVSAPADDDPSQDQAPDDAPAPSDAATDPGADLDSQGTAGVVVDGRSFEFDLRVCGVYGDGEAVISGLGGEIGSDVPSHLDGDSVTWSDGEFRIDIGADGPFQSTDAFLSMGSSLGGTFSLEKSGDGFVVSAQSWNESGSDLGIGTLEFTCR